MRIQNIKKIIVFSILIICFVFSTKTTHAQLATLDAGNIIQTTISAINSGLSAVSEYSIEYKEYVLDGLAGGFAKQIVRQLTSSVVNWINSGFQGSPAFVQNPGAFFLDVADQITGDFISETGILGQLCSPFSIDIRLALAFKYHPNVQKRYTCTLSSIIGNSIQAGKNASINGFTAGDFKQGGWPAFVSLSTEPQNNVYGAYLIAESDLAFQVASLQGQQRDELNQGKGFLSWRDPRCTSKVKKHNAEVNEVIKDRGSDPEASLRYDESQTEGGGDYYSTLSPRSLQSKNDCPIQTPGSVVFGALDKQLGAPLEGLQLADEFNEIVNALFAQLVTQVLQKGLGGVSKRDSSGSSYLQQTVRDINSGGSPQAEKIKAELIKNVEGYKKITNEYKTNRDLALQAMLDVKNTYDSVKACYASKVGLTPSQTNEAQSRIATINNTINTKIAVQTSNLLTLAQDGDYRVSTLQEIQDKTTLAKTLNDLAEPSQKYGELIQSRSLTNAVDIQQSRADLAEAKKKAAALQPDANRELQRCQLFPNDTSRIR